MIRGVLTVLVIAGMASLCGAQDIFDARILKVDIDLPYTNWRDTLTSLKQIDSKDGLRGEVRISGQVYHDVEVRFKGNSSFFGALKTNMRKLPLHLKAAKGERFDGGYKSLKLSNNFRDPSYVRELLAYKIISAYMHVPATLPAVVTVNGNYLGVYTVTEGIEKAMIERVYDDDNGILYKCEPDFTANAPPNCPKGSFSSLQYLGDDALCYKHLYEVDEEEDWQYLIALAKAVNDQSSDLQNILDIHETLWMHALNNVLVNLDSYLGLFAHNYYMFRDSSGVFHPLMWDMNLAFGGFHALKQGTRIDLVQLSPVAHDKYKLSNRPLIYQLLQNRRYRNLYYACIRTLLEDWFLSEAYIDSARAFQQLIDPWVRKEQESQYTYEDFQSSLMHTVKKGNNRSVPGIAQLMIPRTRYLLQHPLIGASHYVIGEWEVLPVGAEYEVRCIAGSDVEHVDIMYSDSRSTAFHTLAMHQSGNMSNGQTVWSIQLADLERFYFISSDNEDVAVYPPASPLHALHVDQLSPGRTGSGE